jgi:hypothetical protein
MPCRLLLLLVCVLVRQMWSGAAPLLLPRPQPRWRTLGRTTATPPSPPLSPRWAVWRASLLTGSSSSSSSRQCHPLKGCEPSDDNHASTACITVVEPCRTAPSLSHMCIGPVKQGPASLHKTEVWSLPSHLPLPLSPSTHPPPGHTPQVLWSYPEGAPAPISEAEVAALCFPHGVAPERLARSPSMSSLDDVVYGRHEGGDERCFVFQLKVGGWGWPGGWVGVGLWGLRGTRERCFMFKAQGGGLWRGAWVCKRAGAG